jgi:hypothetical protein
MHSVVSVKILLVGCCLAASLVDCYGVLDVRHSFGGPRRALQQSSVCTAITNCQTGKCSIAVVNSKSVEVCSECSTGYVLSSVRNGRGLNCGALAEIHFTEL